MGSSFYSVTSGFFPESFIVSSKFTFVLFAKRLTLSEFAPFYFLL